LRGGSIGVALISATAVLMAWDSLKGLGANALI